jgi:C-terminal processing protease CtpA/Prc
MLEPYPHALEGFDYDMSGMFLVARGADFASKTVQSVADGTPASEAGVRKDDQIIAVDHLATADMKLDEVRELFRRAGVTHQLDLRRGADSLSVKLTTRRLV